MWKRTRTNSSKRADTNYGKRLAFQFHFVRLVLELVENAQMKLPYEEACELVKKALAPMGDEYVGLLNKAMTEGWIDVLPNDVRN